MYFPPFTQLSQLHVNNMENSEMNSQSQKRKNSSQMTPVKVIKKKPMAKKSKIDTFFKKIVMLLANFAKIDVVKLNKNRELGVLSSGIKRDGHKKKSGN